MFENFFKKFLEEYKIMFLESKNILKYLKIFNTFKIFSVIINFKFNFFLILRNNYIFKVKKKVYKILIALKNFYN